MQTLLKWTTILVGLMVCGLFAAIIVVTLVIDPNQFKPLIISQFKQLTGFEMQIPGKLSWSFYPHLGMAAEEVSITEPAVFTSRLKNLVLRAKFRPLLHQQLDFTKASIESLQINHLQASRVRARLSLKNQVLELKQLSADLYQGSLNAEATVFLKTPSPNLHVVGKLNQVALAELLEGLSGKSAKLQVKGRADLNWDVTTQGQKTEELLSHLNGSGQIQMAAGSLQGIDLAYFVNTAAALINKEPLPQHPPGGGETQFGQLSGTGLIKDGVISTNNLSLDSSFYTLKATGPLDLVNQTID
ncbi:MAG TPA: AsmA family protein, partial [Gammaproteobacteria bacterium]|nr:AsmA family protein [Gammaproteobacteria bacterium]